MNFFSNNQTPGLCERAVSTYLKAMPLESIHLLVAETHLFVWKCIESERPWTETPILVCSGNLINNKIILTKRNRRNSFLAISQHPQKSIWPNPGVWTWPYLCAWSRKLKAWLKNCWNHFLFLMSSDDWKEGRNVCGSKKTPPKQHLQQFF